MTRSRILIGSITCVIVLVLCSALFSRELQIRRHTSGWHGASYNIAKGQPFPLLRQLIQTSDSPGAYWTEVMDYHEKALFKLGYLTNCEFRFTNQVVTREFSSNFFRLIRQRLGTNEDQVWKCFFLTNQDGIAPILPVKDVSVWKQTFQECAARYA